MKKKPIYEHKVGSVELINAQTLSPTPHFHKEVEIIYIKTEVVMLMPIKIVSP